MSAMLHGVLRGWTISGCTRGPCPGSRIPSCIMTPSPTNSHKDAHVVDPWQQRPELRPSTPSLFGDCHAVALHTMGCSLTLGLRQGLGLNLSPLLREDQTHCLGAENIYPQGKRLSAHSQKNFAISSPPWLPGSQSHMERTQWTKGDEHLVHQVEVSECCSLVCRKHPQMESSKGHFFCICLMCPWQLTFYFCTIPNVSHFYLGDCDLQCRLSSRPC